jgi:hypothetical protein
MNEAVAVWETRPIMKPAEPGQSEASGAEFSKGFQRHFLVFGNVILDDSEHNQSLLTMPTRHSARHDTQGTATLIYCLWRPSCYAKYRHRDVQLPILTEGAVLVMFNCSNVQSATPACTGMQSSQRPMI